MILVLLTMVMSSWKESTWTYLSIDHTDQIAGEINQVLTWRIITVSCHWFVALHHNKTHGEFYICLWQKFCTLEVSSFCLKPRIEEGPLYCGPQLHQWLLKYSFKSLQFTCSVKLGSPSFLGTTHSGIVVSILLQSNWSRLIVRSRKSNI